MSDFNAKFKELRKQKNLTQQDLANEFNEKYGYNFTKASISQYENGKVMPELNALKDFSKYFEVSLDYLLGISNVRNTLSFENNYKTYSEIIDIIDKFFDDDNFDNNDKTNLFRHVSQLYFDKM